MDKWQNEILVDTANVFGVDVEGYQAIRDTMHEVANEVVSEMIHN